MKRCSTCNRTYTDPNLRFCIDDGTPLTDVEPENDDATVVRPHKEEDSWNAVGYQPPRPYVPPGGQAKRRRVWPWLVGIASAFMLGIIVIAIAAVLMMPRLTREVQEAQRDANRRIENSNTAPPETNTNTNTNANSNTNKNVEAPVPTDHDQVLTQLKDIENEWTVANLNADKKKLDRILADDFVAKDSQGELQSKADYLRTIERDSGVEKWEFSNLKLVQTGERATLSGTITYFVEDRKPMYDFTDKFVWRDGRWQATGSDVKEVKSVGVDL